MLMYSVEALQRKIKKEGVDKTIHDLSNATFSEDVKIKLHDSCILINGYPNLSLIYSLV